MARLGRGFPVQPLIRDAVVAFPAFADAFHGSADVTAYGAEVEITTSAGHSGVTGTAYGAMVAIGVPAGTANVEVRAFEPQPFAPIVFGDVVAYPATNAIEALPPSTGVGADAFAATVAFGESAEPADAAITATASPAIAGPGPIAGDAGVSVAAYSPAIQGPALTTVTNAVAVDAFPATVEHEDVAETPSIRIQPVPAEDRSIYVAGESRRIAIAAEPRTAYPTR